MERWRFQPIGGNKISYSTWSLEKWIVSWRMLKEGANCTLLIRILKLGSQDVWFIWNSLLQPLYTGAVWKKDLPSKWTYTKRRCRVTGVAPGSFLVLYTTGLSLWLICKFTNLENTFWASTMFCLSYEQDFDYNFLRAQAFPVVFLEGPPEVAKPISKENI